MYLKYVAANRTRNFFYESWIAKIITENRSSFVLGFVR